MNATARCMKRDPAGGLRYDPGAHFEVRTRDVEYRHDGSKSWLARIYEPQGAGPFPMLIDIHGGGWCKYDRLEDAPVDSELARHGIFVAALDFHLSSEAPYPASLADINYAIRWFKARAADFNASANGVGAIGFSSGGHQAMLSAMRPGDPRYAAFSLPQAPELDAALAYVIVCWPVIDPHARHLYAQSIGNEFLVSTSENYFRSPDGTREGNPSAILERGEQARTPPALYLQGTADVAVPVHLAQDFAGAYARAGGHIELYMAPGAPHIFLRQESDAARRGMALIKSFIQRQLDHTTVAPGGPDHKR